VFAISHRFANAGFRASHRAPLSGSGLPSVVDFGSRVSNGGVLSGQTQPSVHFSRASLRSQAFFAFSQSVA
jgi:hypothetical protein